MTSETAEALQEQVLAEEAQTGLWM